VHMWSNCATTQRYLHLSPAALESRIRSLISLFLVSGGEMGRYRGDWRILDQ